MALHSNYPTFTYISWEGAMVRKGDKSYPVTSGKTNHKYVYWNEKSPNEFFTTQLMLENGSGRYLVLTNDKGMPNIVPQNEVLISFDGALQDNMNAINGIIQGMGDRVDGLEGEVTEKFAGIYFDIDGLQTRVSKTETSIDGVNTEISNIWQKSDEIGSSVEEVNKELDTTNKELTDFKGSMNQEIIDVNSSLGNFSDYVDGAFKDGVIEESEALAIAEHLKNLSKEKLDVDNKVNRLLEDTNIPSKDREVLINAKNSFNAAHDDLIRIINTVIADKKILPSERTLVTNGFANYNFKLADLKKAIDSIIDLGVVKKIEIAKSEVIQTATEITAIVSKTVEELDGYTKNEISQIKQTAQGVTTRVESLETTSSTKNELNNAINSTKEELRGEIADIVTNVGDLEDFIDDAFRDSVISKAETLAIKEHIRSLEVEKTDIDVQVSTILKNTSLKDPYKKNLSDAKSKFDAAHNSLIKNINDAILDEKIEPGESATVDSGFSNYKSNLGLLKQRIEEAIEQIPKELITLAKADIDKDISDVNKSVTSLNNYVDGAFKDGVVDEAEALAIKQHINILNKEKSDVDKEYNTLYSNSDLNNTTEKTNLYNAKNDFNTKHTNLINTVNSAIADGKATSQEVINVNNAFTSYGTSLALLRQRMHEALNKIAQVKADKAQSNANGYTNSKVAEIKVTTDEIKSTVSRVETSKADKSNTYTKTETDSKIQQKADSIDLSVSQKYTTKTENANTLNSAKGYTDGKKTEAVNESKSYTNSRESAIRVDLNGISSSVTNITNNYATKSEMNQTATNIEFKFSSSGGDNILRNSGFISYTSHWVYQNWYGGDTSSMSGVFTTWSNSDSPWIPKNKRIGCFINQGALNNNHWIGAAQYIKLEANTEYTLTGYVSQHRAKRFIIEIKSPNTHGGDAFAETSLQNVSGGSNANANFNQWTKINFKFKTPSNTDGSCLICLWGEGRFDHPAHAYTWVGDLMLTKGSVGREWCPASTETYSGITTIDGDGVKVTHSDGTYSHMGKDGFKHYSGGNGKTYHHMSATGTIGYIQGQTSQWVDLVAVTGDSRWRNKPSLQVTAYIHDISHPASGYALKTCGAKVLDLNRSTGKFRLYNETNAVYYVNGSHLINIPAAITWVAFA